MDTAALNAAVLANHGETGGVTVKVKAGSPPAVTDTVLQAAFRGPWNGATLDGVAVERPKSQLLFISADLTATGAANNDLIVARGTTWTIVDIQPDDGGMSLVTLGAYA